nr:uncharacterized protein LOC129279344 [Lytechinus pictus]
MRESDIRSFGQWICNHDWSEVNQKDSLQVMCDNFYDTLINKMNEYFPLKTIKLHPTDKPWITPYLKSLIHQRQVAFHNDRMRWRYLSNKVARNVKFLKSKFYVDRVQKLKRDNPSSWYKNIKIMTGTDKRMNNDIRVPNIQKDDQCGIANAVNDFFANVSEDIPALSTSELPAYLPSGKPTTIQPWEVYKELRRIQPGKSSGPDGIPARLIREFALELSSPLCKILNVSYAQASVPSQWKKAIIVPIPKDSPPSTVDKLRPISLTDHFSKIAELFIAKRLLMDINPYLDTKQYGCRPGVSTNHCLVDIVNFLAESSEISNNVSTIVCNDFSKAFDRVSHTIAVTKLINLEQARILSSGYVTS